MCNNESCCPPAQIFQESICGNFSGTRAAEIVWSAPAGAYFAGTFEIFNSTSSPISTPVTGTMTSNPVGALSADPGNSVTQSVDQPTNFTITATAGSSGEYCIILYKRILA
ncbi:S-Ena type endospore appendage [Priestia aryabhattai]|uniref:S-Ena type endospore appendage n=1 Tax=Priestia aryabhattai TaxID=412384 RepID=UPI0035683214